MKRLNSYFVYLTIFLFPIGCAAVVFYDKKYFTSGAVSIFIYIIILGLMSFWGFIAYHSKRIYYKNSTLYVYSLFSNKEFIINKDRLGSIDKILFYDPNFYKIIYYDDENNARFIYFIRNMFLVDFKSIIDELNSAEY